MTEGIKLFFNSCCFKTGVLQTQSNAPALERNSDPYMDGSVRYELILFWLFCKLTLASNRVYPTNQCFTLLGPNGNATF